MPIPASSILPTLDELKTHLTKTGETLTGSDDELQDKLDAACELIAKYVGPLDAETVTDEVHDGGQQIVLKRYPVVEVTAASYWDGTEITVSDLEVDPDTGIVEWGYNSSGYFTSGRRNVRITYTAGRSVLPAPLREAILEQAADLWGSQLGNTPALPGPGLPEFDPAALSAGRPALAPHVLSLIEPWLLGPVIA